MSSWGKKNRIVLCAAIALNALCGTAHAETLIGRWCDTWMPTLTDEITIVQLDSGAHQVRHRFSNGSQLTQQLRIRNGAYYIVGGSDTGDNYRITSSGLRLADNDGYIRTAPPTAGDACRRSSR